MKLSLCMIVKNEEGNISRALESVRDVAFESIVVDTGSTDMTVEIAEKLGAKVSFFEWVNDFAAARNFSLEQATGDWILYLDADEYFTPEDAEKLLEFLNRIQSVPEKRKKYHAVSCMLVNIDDSGRQMTKSSILRVFRNDPAIRFTGRIHEQITVSMSCIVHAEHITIYHTGYSESVHRQTGKAQRNIALLRAELKNDPDNLNLKAYLANSLSMGTDEKSQLEAMSLFNEIISSKAAEHVNNVLRVKMYIFMINKHLSDSGKLPECENMCKKALAAFPGTIDFMYFSAVLLSKKGEYDEAWEVLKDCEEKLINNNDSGDSIMITADPAILFSQMILTAKALGDIEGIILYSTHVLTMDKTRLSILSPCIATLLHYGVSEPEVIGLLSNIYDFNDTDDLSLVIKAARDCGATAFAEGIGK